MKNSKTNWNLQFIIGIKMATKAPRHKGSPRGLLLKNPWRLGALVAKISHYHAPVQACYIVYTREKNEPVRYAITAKAKDAVMASIKEVNRIVREGFYPGATPDRKKCGDCTYRRVCV